MGKEKGMHESLICWIILNHSGHQAEQGAVQAWLEHSRGNSLGPAEAVKG